MTIIWILYVKMTCFGVSRVAVFRSKGNISEARTRSTDVVSYLRYDYRLRHVLWISRILPATQVTRPLFYHTYDLLSWIAIQLPHKWRIPYRLSKIILCYYCYCHCHHHQCYFFSSDDSRLGQIPCRSPQEPFEFAGASLFTGRYL